LDNVATEALIYVVAQHQPTLLIVDTLSRATPGGDENAARDLGRAVEATDRIREACGTTVLLVHHSTKDGGSMRGHSSLEGAADSILEARRDGQTVELRNPKQKDAEPAEPLKLVLRRVGESAVLDAKAGGSMPDSERQLLAIIREQCGSTGLSSSELQRRARVSESSFHRSRKSLEEQGLIANIGSRHSTLWVAQACDDDDDDD
jgi:hypothetical protein